MTRLWLPPVFGDKLVCDPSNLFVDILGHSTGHYILNICNTRVNYLKLCKNWHWDQSQWLLLYAMIDGFWQSLCDVPCQRGEIYRSQTSLQKPQRLVFPHRNRVHPTDVEFMGTAFTTPQVFTSSRGIESLCCTNLKSVGWPWFLCQKVSLCGFHTFFLLDIFSKFLFIYLFLFFFARKTTNFLSILEEHNLRFSCWGHFHLIRGLVDHTELSGLARTNLFL